jgi:hypothetical protein
MAGVTAVVSVMLPRYLRRRHELASKDMLGWWKSQLYQIVTNRNDSSYIHCFGLDVATFDRLLKIFATKCPDLFPPNQDRLHRGRKKAIDERGLLAVLLYYYITGASAKQRSVAAGVSRWVLGRYFAKAMPRLLEALNELPDAGVYWPTVKKMREMADVAARWIPGLHYCWGAVDGLNIKIHKPADPTEQNAYYNGWLAGTYISGIFVFGFDGCICWWRHNLPGSWHDAKIAAPLYSLLAKMPAPWRICGDSAFPKGPKETAGKIITSLKKKYKVPKEGDRHAELMAMHRKATSMRQISEWGMGLLQKTFRCLGSHPFGLPACPKQRKVIVTTVVRLFNLRTRAVGFNQIRTVYERVKAGTHISPYELDETNPHRNISHLWVAPH